MKKDNYLDILKVVMCSRFGDVGNVGITTDLSVNRGYQVRIDPTWLKVDTK